MRYGCMIHHSRVKVSAAPAKARDATRSKPRVPRDSPSIWRSLIAVSVPLSWLAACCPVAPTRDTLLAPKPLGRLKVGNHPADFSTVKKPLGVTSELLRFHEPFPLIAASRGRANFLAGSKHST